MKVLFIQHVEKVILVIILILCGLWINGLIHNPKTLPNKQAEETNINKMLHRIQVAVDAKPPVPEKPMDYTGVIQNRLSLEVGFADTLQWLTGHPDIVEGSTGSKNVFSIYQIAQPSVTVVDEVGSVLLQVTVPDGGSDRGDEVKSGSEVVWTRQLPNNEPVQNHAHWLGVHVEFKAGTDGKWNDLRSAGRKGIYLFKQGDYSLPEFRHNGVRGKQRYAYRASLLVVATGINEAATVPEIGEETIVFSGAYKGSIDRKSWAQKGGKITGRLQPLAADAIPAQAALQPKEQVYAGDAGSVGVVEAARSDMIMAVDRVGGLGGEVTLSLYMMKMVRDIRGNIMGWTEPEKFDKIRVGDKLGAPERRVKIRGREDMGFVLVDFSSDWVLQDMSNEGQRVLYYEVKKVRVPPDQTYPDGVKLELREKTKSNYDTIKINNGIETVELIGLERSMRMRPEVMKYCYPLLPGNAELFSEKDAFMTGDPLDFTQPILTPEKPIEKPASDLPPVEVEIGEKPFQTNIPYFVFPDNRVVFWDHVNNELRILGKEPMKKVEEPAVDPDVAPADGAASPADEPKP